MHDLKVSSRQAPVSGLPPRRRALGPDSVFWLVLVSLAFLAAELTPALLRMPLGADEITYIARTSAHASLVSLPPVHGQGAGLLAAPVTLFTQSLTVTRVWMSVLSAIGLFLSVLCWRGLRPFWVLALGELILASLGISQFSGVQIYPDWWGALATLALSGLFLQAVHGTLRNRVALPLIAVASLVIVLMRPQNIVFLMGPVIVAALVVRRWRRLRVLVAMGVGVALGCLEWVAGAYLWYGGLFERIHLAGQEPPPLGFYFALGTQVKVLNGPWYCIPPSCTSFDAPGELAWWIPFLALGVLGLWVGWKRRGLMRASAVLAGGTALWVFVLYSFLVPFGAPRYILPSLALLAILAADGIAWAIRGLRWRKTVVVLSCLFLVSGMISQRILLNRQVQFQIQSRNYQQQAAELRELGVRAPCAMEAPSVAYYLGCSAPWTGMTMPEFLARTPEGIKGWRLLQIPGLTTVIYMPANSPLMKGAVPFRELPAGAALQLEGNG